MNSKKISLNQQIQEALAKKGIRNSCPMCQQEGWIFPEDITLQKIHHAQNNNLYLPTVPLICQHCGFVSYHALGVLNLINTVKME